MLLDDGVMTDRVRIRLDHARPSIVPCKLISSLSDTPVNGRIAYRVLITKPTGEHDPGSSHHIFSADKPVLKGHTVTRRRPHRHRIPALDDLHPWCAPRDNHAHEALA